MKGGGVFGQPRRGMSRLAFYAVTFCLVSLTMWTMVLPPGENVTIKFTSSNEIIKGAYRCAYGNPDGTVDLVFNIPKDGKSLLQLDNAMRNTTVGEESHLANETIGNITTAAPKRPRFRSVYPVSLDQDYAINSVHVCPIGQQVDYLIIVHSAAAYSARRRFIRETYGGKKLFGNIVQRVVFLLGKTPDPFTSKSIQEEAFLNRDIVQGQFMDSYYNLTNKGILAYRWASEHCPQAKIIIKTDDDVFLNPFKLVREVLPELTNRRRHIACHLRHNGTSPIVRGKGKWQVRENEFRGHSYYPFDYCNGYFVIITGDLIRPMLMAARQNPFFLLDDVYLFGILPATVGFIKFVDIKDSLTLSFDAGRQCFEDRGLECEYLAVSQWRVDEMDKLWYILISSLPRRVKEELNVFGLF